MRRVLWGTGMAFAVLLCLGQEASAADRHVCGLNLSGLSWVDWAERDDGGPRFTRAPIADHESIVELQRLTGTDYLQDERPELGLPPALWLIRGASNAFAGGVGTSRHDRTTEILLDDRWLRDMERRTSNPWLRSTVIAHELGHLVHGDPWKRASTWHEEYEADEFAGYAMSKLGAPEERVRELYYLISEESTKEDMSRHPSRAYRLHAIAKGYARARRE